MVQSTKPKGKKPRNIILRLLGPGLVTGAADDDPSGIATYSQAGAQFGYGLLWIVFLTTPFMIAIQLMVSPLLIGNRSYRRILMRSALDFAVDLGSEQHDEYRKPNPSEKNQRQTQ